MYIIYKWKKYINLGLLVLQANMITESELGIKKKNFLIF